MIEWFEECAGEFFETHTELGESREVAESLIQEVLHFEESTKVRGHGRLWYTWVKC